MSFVRKEPAFFFCLTVIFVFLFLRNPNSLLYPPVFVEDGPYMLGYFYENRAMSSVFRFYGGYISLGPNIIGYLAGIFGIVATPFFLSFLPLMVSAFTFSIVSLHSFDHIGRSLNARVAICLFTGFLPAGNFALVSNTTYSLWHMFILLSILSILWTPKSHKKAIAVLPIFFILIWSHPFSLLLVPVYIFRIFCSETRIQKNFFYLLIGITASYYVFGINHSSITNQLSVGSVLLDWGRVFFERVIFERLFMTKIRMILVSMGWQWVMHCVSIFVLFVLGVYIFYRNKCGKVDVGIFALFLYLSIGASLLSVYTRGAFLDTEWAHRYTYPSSLFISFSVALSAINPKRKLSCLANSASSDIAVSADVAERNFTAQEFKRFLFSHNKVLTAIIILLIIANYLSLNFFYINSWEGNRIIEFVKQVAAKKKDHTQPWCLKIDRKEWTIIVNPWGLETSQCKDTQIKE
jgi:hypothetical protein